MKHIFLFATLFVAVIMLASCKKNKPGEPSGYPKEVTIQFRVTSPSGLTDYFHISYDNETGGSTDLWDGKLPFTKEIKKTVEWASSVSVYASAKGDGSVKTEILVNGKVVADQTHTSNDDPSGLVSYQFQ